MPSRSAGQPNFLHMSRLFRTPLLDTDLGLRLLDLTWLLCLAHCHDFRLTACQEQLRRFCQIFTDMKTIGYLNGLGSSGRCRRRVLAPTIPAHDRNFRALPHPMARAFGTAVREQVNHAVAFQGFLLVEALYV